MYSYLVSFLEAEMPYRERIKKHLTDILKFGASGVALIGPDGFPLESIGDISSRDESLSIVFSIGIPSAIDSINRNIVSRINSLLHERLKLVGINLSEFSFEIGDRYFIGLYVDGYTIVASAKRVEDIDNIRIGLINVLSKVFEIFSTLSGKKMRIPLLEVPITKTPETKITAEKRISEIIPREELEDMRLYLLKVREIVFDIKKDLIEKGDWYSLLQGFKRFKEKIEELKKLNKDLGEHPAIRAIYNWTIKTIEKVKTRLETSGNELIDEEHKNVIRRSLSKAVEFIKKVVFEKFGEET